MILQPPRQTFKMTREEIRALARAVAADLRKAAAAGAPEPLSPTGGGSRQRGLPEELRLRIIEVRAALFQRGIFDPALVRFDTATVPQSTALAIADSLAKAAEAL
jgi:hypothetical protein